MPMINIEDAYILDETGAQVDQVTGLYFKNENASDTEKAQARANIGAGGSNDNLLDNAYFVGGGSQLGDGIFPINQRGQTSYTGQLAIDRWHADDTITLYSDYLNTGNGTIYQVCDNGKITPLLGKAVTASMMLADGTIVSDTQVFPDDTNNRWVIFGSTGMASFLAGTSSQIIRLPGSNNIKAAKLELGTVSTLANDGPPDFWAELEKCMRRFRRIKAEASYYIFATVLAEAATYTVGMIDLPVPMASKPTISTNGSFRLWTGTGENPVTVSSIGIFDAICPLTNCSRIGIIAYPSANLTADARYDLQANNDTNAYIDLSCEI